MFREGEEVKKRREKREKEKKNVNVCLGERKGNDKQQKNKSVRKWKKGKKEN